ncbi:MAG: PAS domain-containing sensor histidine kinase [Leptolyngbya sp. SIO1E4]|nr:PAS domain-containing sensor histidine kinase [Leptolyngbya sp. SIO1E4]
MAIASGLFLVSSTIAGFGLGWALHKLWGQPSPSIKITSRLDRDHPDLVYKDTERSIQSSTGHFPTPDKPSHTPRPSAYALLQQAPVGYLEVDKENQLLWSNPLACQMLGIPYDDADNPTPPRLLLELVRSYELDQLIEMTRQTKTSVQKDWVLNFVSLDPINPHEGVAAPLRGHGIPLDNNHVGVFLENRQEAQTLLQQRNRWTSDVAHELKTPLTSIRLVAETLRSRVDPTLTTWLDRLLNEILRLSNLVEDLLNLSRLERSGGTGLTLKPVELPHLLFAAWQSLEPLAEVKQVEIAYEGPTELIVNLDETLIHRVLINLMDNAIKYSPQKGTIFVRAGFCQTEKAVTQEGQPTQLLFIDIVDEGSGFLENDLPYIFDRFYRADPSRSRVFTGIESDLPDPEKIVGRSRNSGTGLGLAIVQQITEAHGGTTQARNHPETGGGWLTISIPVTPVSLENMSLTQ